MTNKINGIDVSECSFYNKGECDNPNIMACNCINNKDCYFKGLKHSQEKINRLENLLINRLNIYQRQRKKLEQIKEIVSGNYETLDPQTKQDIKRIIYDE